MHTFYPFYCIVGGKNKFVYTNKKKEKGTLLEWVKKIGDEKQNKCVNEKQQKKTI